MLRPIDDYDDENIPEEDLPQDESDDMLKDMIPDEVPRRDGPRGEKRR